MHIGTHKTGSTSLQYFFNKNRHALLDQKILYPQTGLPLIPNLYGHHDLVFNLRSNDPKIWSDLVQEINASDCESVIISSEEMDTLTTKQIELIKSRLIGFNVKIIIYLREQVDYFESLYWELVKSGIESDDISSFILRNLNLGNYFALLSKWNSHFDADCISIRIFSKTLNVIDDFCHLVDINKKNLSNSNEHVNVSPPRAYVDLIRKLNKFGEINNLGKCNKKLINQILLVAKDNPERKLGLVNPALKEFLRNYFLKTNSKVTETYYQNNSGNLIFQSVGIEDFCEDWIVHDEDHMLSTFYKIGQLLE